jgi:hypothetical protein
MIPAECRPACEFGLLMSQHDRPAPSEEQKWLDGQEQACLEYLKSQGVPVGDFLDIDWFAAPTLSLWSSRLGGRKYWVIGGDIPVDYLFELELVGVRAAMQAFAARWESASEVLLQGQVHPTIRIGEGRNPEELVELGRLLDERVRLLRSVSQDGKGNSTLKELEAHLQALPLEGQLCFGLLCAERCLAECRHLPPNEAERVHLLEQVATTCLRKLLQGNHQYGDLEALHQNAGELIPEADEESRPPEICVRAAYAVCELCMIFQMPEMAAHYAALIGAEVIYLRCNLYSKGGSLDAPEREWQLRLIERIAAEGPARGGRIPKSWNQHEYDCGEYRGWYDE